MSIGIRALLIDGYAWLEVCHIIGTICWFAALFCLPQLFACHAAAQDGIGTARFGEMESGLYYGLGTPAMILSLLTGGVLSAAFPNYFLGETWFYAKMALVVLLIIYHLSCGYFLQQFRKDKNRRDGKFYRSLNWIPMFLLVGISVMVKVRPF